MSCRLGYTLAPIDITIHGVHNGNQGPSGRVAVELQQASTCPTCGATMREVLPRCAGEKKFDRDHFSLKNFSHEALHELAHFDSKIFRTVRYLFTKPGSLPRNI